MPAKPFMPGKMMLGFSFGELTSLYRLPVYLLDSLAVISHGAQCSIFLSLPVHCLPDNIEGMKHRNARSQSKQLENEEFKFFLIVVSAVELLQ